MGLKSLLTCLGTRDHTFLRLLTRSTHLNDLPISHFVFLFRMFTRLVELERYPLDVSRQELSSPESMLCLPQPELLLKSNLLRCITNLCLRPTLVTMLDS